MKIPDSIAFWRRPKVAYEFNPEPNPEPKQELKPSKINIHELTALKEEVKNLKDENKRLMDERSRLISGQQKLLQWVKTTHRLTTAPEGIRAMIQGGRRIVPILVMLLACTSLVAQAPPIIRQPLTTNFHFGPVPSEGEVPIWNATAMKWSNAVISAGSAGLTTNLNQFLGVPLSIKNESLLTNTFNYGILHVIDSNLTVRIGSNVNLAKGSGLRNTFIGANIAYNSTVNSNDIGGGIAGGSDNVAIGSHNMVNLTNGYRNTVIGSFAGANISNGWLNVFIGFGAGRSCIDGSDNIGIGDGALFLGEGAGFFGNTAVGEEAGLTVSNVLYNTLYGYQAGYGHVTPEYLGLGPSNVYIGAFAGGHLRTNNTGHEMTVGIGTYAGYEGGKNCIYLGHRAGLYNTNDDQVVIIDGLDRLNYNGAKIGSLIYGNLNSTVTNQTIQFNAGGVAVPFGKLGIGITNIATNTLEVLGQVVFRDNTNGNAAGMKFQSGISGDSLAMQMKTISDGRLYYDFFNHVFRSHSGAEYARIDGSGRLGLGITAPSEALTVMSLSGNGGNGSFVGFVAATNGLRAGNNSQFNVSSVGVTSFKTQTSLSNNYVGGTLFVNRGNNLTNFSADGTFTNLAAYSVPAHTLTNALDMVRSDWGGKMADATANTNNFQIVYGSQTILDTGLNIASNCAFRAWVEITRTGNTAQHAEAHLEWGPGGGVPFAYTNVNIEITQTNGINTTLSLRGAARRLFAHTNNFMRVQYFPAL